MLVTQEEPEPGNTLNPTQHNASAVISYEQSNINFAYIYRGSHLVVVHYGIHALDPQCVNRSIEHYPLRERQSHRSGCEGTALAGHRLRCDTSVQSI